MKHRSLLGLAVFFLSPAALAAPGPDLTVTLTPPSGVHVYENGRYDLVVRNQGNKNAAGVRLLIDLPKTSTSPQVYIMGTLGARSAACQVVNKNLDCSLGTINRGTSKSVFFEIAMPYAAKPLVFTATSSTTTAEPNTGNNGASHTADLLTYAVDMDAPPSLVDRLATNSHCTGNAGLSSYFECELFPSSISDHITTFVGDGTITFDGNPPGYTGSWTLSPDGHTLEFFYYENLAEVAHFIGEGVDGNCFEGETTFPGSSYESIYQVCLDPLP